MSLFNEAAETLAEKGITGTIDSVASGVAGKVGGAVGGLTGNAQATKLASGMAGRLTSAAASKAVNRFMSPSMQKYAVLGAGVGTDLASGNLLGAGMRVLNSGVLDGLFGGVIGNARYWGTATPLLGGISPAEASRIYQEAKDEQYARKNLFLLDITSALGGGAYNMPDRFNLFATEIDYSPCVISGESQKVGGANVDGVLGNEPVEVRITTLDDAQGTLKRWFGAHHAAAAARNGTVGEPAKYAITIRILHAVCDESNASDPFEVLGIFRTGNLDVSLSRREDGLEELQMTFVQLDTFMRP